MYSTLSYNFLFFNPLNLFFFNDTATTEIYTLSLHDALPIAARRLDLDDLGPELGEVGCRQQRSEEHTSELQSRVDIVCRLLLEIKNKHFRSSLSCFTRPIKHLAHRQWLIP